MSKLGAIEQTKPQRCDLCHQIAETRPYGPNGENVCFTCGMKDETAAKRGMNQLIFGGGNS